MDKETKLHKLAKKQEDLSVQLGMKPSTGPKELKQAAEVMSDLKYKALEAKNKYEHAIEQKEMEKTQSGKSMKLPSLPVLPARVGELQQQIALHNVNMELIFCHITGLVTSYEIYHLLEDSFYATNFNRCRVIGYYKSRDLYCITRSMQFMPCHVIFSYACVVVCRTSMCIELHFPKIKTSFLIKYINCH